MQLKEKKQRSFDLFTDALYSKAADAINNNVKDVVKTGVKSSATLFDYIEELRERWPNGKKKRKLI